MGNRKPYATIDTQTNKSLSHIIHIPTNQIRVIAIVTTLQLLVCSLICNYTIVNHEDDIYNRTQMICHHSRMILSPHLQHRQESLTVQGTHSLVKNQDTRMTQERSGNRSALLLSTRNGCSKLANKRVVALRERTE